MKQIKDLKTNDKFFIVDLYIGKVKPMIINVARVQYTRVGEKTFYIDTDSRTFELVYDEEACTSILDHGHTWLFVRQEDAQEFIHNRNYHYENRN